MNQNDPAIEPKVEYRELIRSIARELNEEELHQAELLPESESCTLAVALKKMSNIPLQRIEDDVFEERAEIDEDDRQDDEDRYGALNQDGLFPHEVEPG